MADKNIDKILIVEDDSGLAHLQEARLSRRGYHVTKAATVAEVLSLCERAEFDLFILDYRLEGDLTGLMLYQMLQERGYRTPAILVTGFEDPTIIVESIRAGVRDFIPKNAEVLNTLPLAVERVLDQVRIERELVAAKAVQEKQEQLQAAFEAAKLASWNWDLRSGKRTWAGFCEEIFGCPLADLERPQKTLVPCVHPEDAQQLEAALEHAREGRLVFSHEFRILRESQGVRWILAKGRFYYDENKTPLRMAGVIVDTTERKFAEMRLAHSHAQIRALNDRLKLSVVEAHHRVKNSLQGVISLVNLQIQEKGTLSESDVKKIIAHVQGVASLHDVLSESSKNEGDVTKISLVLLFEKMLAFLATNHGDRMIRSELEECSVTAKRGATLSVVLNELVSNALKHSAGNILITLKNLGESGELSVENEGSQFPAGFSADQSSRTGLLLLSMLCRIDLQNDPIFENLPSNRACVRVRFPLER